METIYVQDWAVFQKLPVDIFECEKKIHQTLTETLEKIVMKIVMIDTLRSMLNTLNNFHIMIYHFYQKE